MTDNLSNKAGRDRLGDIWHWIDSLAYGPHRSNNRTGNTKLVAAIA